MNLYSGLRQKNKPKGKYLAQAASLTDNKVPSMVDRIFTSRRRNIVTTQAQRGKGT
jgi:hypothetical protein